MDASPPASGLINRLLQEGLLDADKLHDCLQSARKQALPPVTVLVQQQVISGAVLAHFVAQEFGLPLFDLNALDHSALPQHAIKPELIRSQQLLPLFRRGNRLDIATADPSNLQGLNDIKFQTGLSLNCIVVEAHKLAKLIETLYGNAARDLQELIDGSHGDTSAATQDAGLGRIDEEPIVRFVNGLLSDAVRKEASDIHIEPYEHSFRIRFRHDGILHEVAAPPATLAARIVSRIKVMAHLNIAEHRLPQDGRIKTVSPEGITINFRVNTCPTLYGEKIVLRLLDSDHARLDIDQLGFEPEQRQAFLDALKKPYGMILVTGPTGSGKTVTLYSGLGKLNTADVNISTAEDPVEIVLPGVNQVNVTPKTGLTFAEAMRAFLRQDPDILMVGEIRDLETAEIAVKAAQTGHLLLSTLHTNDAPQTLTRLLQMGIPPFNIASSVLLIIAQRLARRLCPHCKRAEKLPLASLLEAGFSEQEIAGLTVYAPTGCEHCVKGYRGRVGIYQVMPISDALNRIILEGGNVIALNKQAQHEGIVSLREAGLKKVADGITSLAEIDRITRD
ncbi:type IV-A pilus assembly ATPase PilB [Candidatus Methylospira mobilis]|uniref:type IV-A pilus assembly ATPase PilB n=1 Tax=Candidatus Methylospira mobilis TaxID=1808979 RepID=UPI0028E27CFD|nr:type IV-A pilus assembly ATPase PilB [Candidatus Methylospira mobilis]WNV06217.1 type IV-A pilus assembly ATPase PilB [Candidatus Methylospira mobilis]